MTSPALVDPHPRFHRSFLAAADEFLAAGEDRYANLLSWPAEGDFPGIGFDRRRLGDVEEFERFCDFLVGQRREHAPRPPAYVPFTEKWIDVDGEYVGRISLRHRLTQPLLTWGGHIGYAVRPTARRRGHASRALALMLPVAAEQGIDPVLVTCDVGNEGSRRAIERNGGAYEDTRRGKLRYWIPTTR